MSDSMLYGCSSAVVQLSPAIDNIGIKGAGTYTYQVCESGSGGACSNSATVAF